MIPIEVFNASERIKSCESQQRDPDIADLKILAAAYQEKETISRISFDACNTWRFERAIMTPEDVPGAEVWPDWVYEAREAVKKARAEKPDWLNDLLVILGWQGGTVYQAMQAVKRLVHSDKRRPWIANTEEDE